MSLSPCPPLLLLFSLSAAFLSRDGCRCFFFCQESARQWSAGDSICILSDRGILSSTSVSCVRVAPLSLCAFALLPPSCSCFFASSFPRCCVLACRAMLSQSSRTEPSRPTQIHPSACTLASPLLRLASPRRLQLLLQPAHSHSIRHDSHSASRYEWGTLLLASLCYPLLLLPPTSLLAY